MPNKDGFIVDDREQTEYPLFRNTEVCMSDCITSDVEIMFKATDINVTPED